MTNLIPFRKFSTFALKYRDTKPDLLVTLKNPDDSIHDLTGATDVKLHVWLSDGVTVVTRAMVIVGVPTSGQIKYTWLAADWTGALIVGSHRMEYEVVGGTGRLTFPNDGYDELLILPDIGQG